jgi:hypothetical protein
LLHTVDLGVGRVFIGFVFHIVIESKVYMLT